jgi:hypothetical protein
MAARLPRQVVGDRRLAYRRPLPSTCLRFLSTVMWMGENHSAAETETAFSRTRGRPETPGTRCCHGACAGRYSPTGAVVGHRRLRAGLFSRISIAARSATTTELGGPLHLQAQNYYPSINDSLRMIPMKQIRSRYSGFNALVAGQRREPRLRWHPGSESGQSRNRVRRKHLQHHVAQDHGCARTQ